MRTVDFPLPFSGLVTLPDTPPVPIAATIDAITFDWTITFDDVLRPAHVNSPNLRLVTPGFIYPVTFVGFSGRVLFGTAVQAPLPGPDTTVSYFASPPQLRSMALRLVAAFIDFPLAVV